MIQRRVLTGKHRRNLRALGHSLTSIVQVGKNGLDDTLVGALDRALTDHELVKVKLGENAGVDRHEASELLATRTKSEVAQVLGGTVLLYRAHPEKPMIDVATGTRKEPVKAVAPAPRPAKKKPARRMVGRRSRH